MRTSPVFIVGAGPTGLVAALDLARGGIPCRIIDKRPEPEPHSRAVSLQARTLELFQQHGIIDPFLRLGHRADVANFLSDGHEFLRLDFGRLETPHPYLLFLDQAITERIVTQRLADLGVTVERGVELTGFTQSRDGVVVHLNTANGTTEDASGSFLIGCDGAHSFVREHLNLGFQGKTFAGTYLVADIRLEWEHPDSELFIYNSDEGVTSLFPMSEGYHRIVADFQGQPRKNAPSLADCQQLLDTRIEYPVHVTDLRWSAYFHVNSRRVEHIRVGRVFLAGDAAHIHSPATGMGMNTGIQEAINLAWKVAFVARGDADFRLLDTYEEERAPIEKQVLRGTEAVFRLMGAESGPSGFFRDHVLPLFDQSERAQSYMARFISQLSINYRSSSLSSHEGRFGTIRAGDRAPDANLRILADALASDETHALYDIHDSVKFTLLCLASVPSQSDASLRRELQPLTGTLLPSTNIFSVYDEAGTYRAERPAFCLIRPDGYVLTCGAMERAESAADFCKSWFRSMSHATV